MSDLIKAIARAAKFLSIGLMFSFVTGLLLVDEKAQIPKWHRMFGHFGAIGSIVSGLVNWWYLKSFKPHADKKSFVIWTSIVHSKVLLVLIFFTPIIRLFTSNEKTINKLQIANLVVLACVSPFVRKLREGFSPK